MKPISTVVPQVPREAPVRAADKVSSDAFEEALTRASLAITKPQVDASRAVEAFARGGSGNLHDTILAVEKADISLKFLVSVRNRLIESYREVMRMGM